MSRKARRISALLAAAAVVGGCAVPIVKSNPEPEVHDLVKRYLEAQSSGNAAKACDSMTTNEWRDLLAVANDDQSIRSATRADCMKVILKPDPASRDRDPGNHVFRDLGYKMDIQFLDGQAAVAYPKGRDEPSFEAIKDGGTWKIDGLAWEKVSFVKYCGENTDKSRCRCLFDQLRSLGHNSWDDIATVMRNGSADLVTAGRVCGGMP